jgi:hypothetical protein
VPLTFRGWQAGRCSSKQTRPDGRRSDGLVEHPLAKRPQNSGPARPPAVH